MTEWLVGGYGPDMDGLARGITKLRSRPDGSLEPVEGFLIDLPSPAFLARGNGVLYAALEGAGAVQQVDGERFASGGVWPCHIGVYGDDVIVANYAEGNLGLRGGQVVEAEPGGGPHASQDRPHAHSTAEIAPGVILSADLGADRIGVHSLFDGVLTLADSHPLRPGTGPRDLLVVDTLVYILGEHGCSVTVAEWVDGALLLIDEVALPGAEDGDQAAGLALGNGALYVGLRGSNQISVLSVSADGRQLEGVASVSSAGDWPRHLVLHEGVLHVANQRSSSVASFSVGADGIPRLIAPPCFSPTPTYLLLD